MRIDTENTNGFTIIELLVLIIIIGILAFGVSAVYKNAIDKTHVAQAQEKLQEISDILHLSTSTRGEPLIRITGSRCSDCYCRGISDLSLISNDHRCAELWYRTLDAVSHITGIDITSFKRDPWGSPYLVDENEGESSHSYCRRDTLASAGPEKKWSSSEKIGIEVSFYDTSCN